MFAALVAASTASSLSCPPAAGVAASTEALAAVARGASPRVEIAGPGVVVIDARGLTRLFGQEAQVAALCRQQAADRGVAAAVAMASTRTAALLLALDAAERIAAAVLDASRAVVTVPPVIVPAGAEAAALAPLPIALVARLAALDMPARPHGRAARASRPGAPAAPSAPTCRWPCGGAGGWPRSARSPRCRPPISSSASARPAWPGTRWRAGVDARPLVPTAEPQPFEATCAFEWPIEAIEPLSFALGRVIDPLCARLDHDGLGTVTLQTTLRLVTRELYVRRLGLPMPMRDPRGAAHADRPRSRIASAAGRHRRADGDVRAGGRPHRPAVAAGAGASAARDDRDADRPAARGDGRRPRRQPGRARHAPRRGDWDAAVRRARGGPAARRRRDAIDGGARPGRRRPADAAPVPASRRRCASSSIAGGRCACDRSSHGGCRGSGRCGSPPVRGDRRATGGGSSRRARRRAPDAARAAAHRRSGSPIRRCGATSRPRPGTRTSGTSSSNRGPRCASRAIDGATPGSSPR